jgi:hypothetical protein
MSKLILPSPVILASESFDVDTSGIGPAGATANGAATLSPLRFLIPAYATTKDSSIDIELAVTSAALAGNYTLSPQLVFTDPDGVSNNTNYLFQGMTIDPTTAQIARFSIKIFFAKGASGAPGEYRPVMHYRGISCTVDGSGVTNLDTASYNTSNSPAMTRMDYPRALTVQLIRAGAGTSRMNVRFVRAVGYNLNMDNWTV